MTSPFRSCVLTCIAIVLLSACVELVSADSGPRITGLSPSGGPADGGTLVTITGSGFSGATDVRFGGKSGTGLAVVNDSRLTIISPPNPAGTVAVSIISVARVISSRDPSTMYMYEGVARPRVSGISPSSGPVAGGTVVTITGSGFNGTEYVQFGGKYARDLKIVDDSHLSVITPAFFPGFVPVAIKNAAGIGISQEPATMYLYEFPLPELTSISPSSGSTAGGTVVTVTGSGFSGATDVRFGGVSGTGLNVIDNSQLTIVSPPNPAGTVGLSVINHDHAGSSAGPATVFRYDVPFPRLTSISPSSGSTAGGTVVTITGSGFTGTKDVQFGKKSGTALNITDDNHITIISPAHSPGSVPISITNPAGVGGSLGPSTLFQYVFSPATATNATKNATPAQGNSREDMAVSFPATSPALTAATATSGTRNTPGFEAVGTACAVGALLFLRKTDH
jgi:hypothetical protein